MAYMRLGDLLLSSGVISHEQLERALELQKESKERLGDVLVQSGIITEQQLIEALKIQLGVEFVDLTAVSIPVELAKYVPRTLAKKYCVVPVKLVRDTLYLAMSDPLDFIAQEEIKAASRKRVIPMIATHRATEQAISRLYGSEDTARVIEEMKREAGSAGPDIVPAQLAKDGDSSEGAPTIRFVNSLIERAFAERASDIHLEPQEGEMVVRMRIDGLLRRVLTVPAELQSTVISRLKIMGGMDIAERKVPQDGHAMLRVKGSEIDLRISSMPTVYGEKIVLRLLNKTSQLLSRDAIGLEGDDLESYQALLRNTGGVILLVGPTGSGKSTTMCVMLRDLAREEVNIVTLEDPVEYYIPGVSQCQINEKTGMTFASGLRAILRQDPDIISVGEIRDGETAEIAMRAAMTGHLVITTIHTEDAISAIDRLRDTSESHDRCSVVEVMGRNAGYIALNVAIASGAMAVLLPEKEFDMQRDILDKIVETQRTGKRHFIVIVAEGIGHSQEIANEIQARTGIDTRATILGHVQRGGSPTLRDRVNASAMGYHAVCLLEQGKYNRIVGMKGEELVDYPVDEALEMTKSIDPVLVDVCNTISI